MRLDLNRFVPGADATLGKLEVPSVDIAVPDTGIIVPPTTYFTLEDELRKVKVPGETCIDAGEYRIRLRREGGMVKRYDRRLAPFHDGMLWLQDVRNFVYVYLHIGNDDDDTDGCILTGMLRGPNMTIRRSAEAYSRIYKAVWKYADADDLSIVIRDPPAR